MPKPDTQTDTQNAVIGPVTMRRVDYVYRDRIEYVDSYVNSIGGFILGLITVPTLILGIQIGVAIMK